MKIARMPYINVDPFYYTLEYVEKKPNIELVVGYPREIGIFARTKDGIDAAPISVMDFLNLKDIYEPMRMCVAVKKKAGSVNLFTKVPVKALSGRRIGITSQTSTSKVLMKIILEQRYGVRSVVYLDQPELRSVDAYLLIGNNALLHAHNGLKGFDYMYDLGEEWYKWTGLPFVFAVWAVKKSIPEADKDYLAAVLKQSMELFWKHEKEMAKRRSEELLISPASIMDYWHLFIYNQTPGIDKSLKLFERYAKTIKGVFANG
ncbi:MAG: menaquinone biosynthetic enzyme MqnA/MqnD family protein [bacterium]